MAGVDAFVSSGYGSRDWGSGAGSGLGYGEGSGSGFASSKGYGSGLGYCEGPGPGYGSSNGSGSKYGEGYGYGEGSGKGSGGDGGGGGFHNLGSINGLKVHYIDDVPTVIYRVNGDCAKGAIVKIDLSLSACYVMRGQGMYAHGKTLRGAQEALSFKIIANASEDERIDAFLAEHEWGVEYSTTALYVWHGRLTGSCEMGRKAFIVERGIDLDGTMTVERFIALTRDAYGGETIKRLEARYKEVQNA